MGSKLYVTHAPAAEAFTTNDWDLYQADWVLDGNANDKDDREDIESGVSLDTNSNDIPDQ